MRRLWPGPSRVAGALGLRSARGRAILASAVLLLLLGSVAALATWRAQYDKETNRSLDRRSAVVAALEDARAHTFLMAAEMAASIFSEDASPVQDLYPQSIQSIDEDIKMARAELTAKGETEELAALNAVDGEMNQLMQDPDVIALVTAMGTSTGVVELGRQVYPRIWPRVEAMMADLDKLAASERSNLVAQREAAVVTANRSLALLIGFSAFAFLGAAATLIALVVSVVRPLASLKASARAVASGDLDTRTEVSGPEEVASLANDFNAMVEERRRAEEALKRQATTDSLTGLFNHRSLLDSLSREIDISIRSGQPLTVLMMDINGFKLFNDTYGHALGDEVLKAVAGVLRQVIDDSGIPGRYGGDEFLVILPGADRAAASAFADRLVATIGRTEFEASDGSRIPISLSMGAASLPEDTESRDRLLALADTAMYEAKRLGGIGRVGPRLMTPDAAAYTGAFAALDSLLQAIQYRDHYTKTHSDVVAQYAAELALQAGLSEQAIRAIRIAGVLHDVGKLIIPDDILKKPGPLAEEEWEVVKRHPLVGEMLIRETPFLEDVIQAVGCHHEHYDGTGYPRGLRGEDIPLLGRVLTIADAYSAMCLDRPYRKALSTDEIIAELTAGAGTAFDPRLVGIFVEMLQGQKRALAA